MWARDNDGDLVNLDQVTRLTTSGSGSTWNLAAKMTTGSDVVLGTYTTQVAAQDAAEELVDRVGN